MTAATSSASGISLAYGWSPYSTFCNASRAITFGCERAIAMRSTRRACSRSSSSAGYDADVSTSRNTSSTVPRPVARALPVKLRRSGSTTESSSPPTSASSVSICTRDRDAVPVSTVFASTSAWAECAEPVLDAAGSANGTRSRSSTIGTVARRTTITRRPFGSVVSTVDRSAAAFCEPSSGNGRGPTAVRPISSAERWVLAEVTGLLRWA